MDVEISEYEKIREENMKRNADFLASIGLDSAKPDMKGAVESAKKVSKRGVSVKRKLVDLQPVRRSGRVTIERLKAEDFSLLSEEDRKKKEEELARMLEDKQKQIFESSVMVENNYGNDRWSRNEEESISLFETINEPEDYDKAEHDDEEWAQPIVDTFKRYASPVNIVNDWQEVTKASPSSKKSATKQGGSTKSSLENYTKRMSKLVVTEQDVAKVVEQRTCAVWIHPSSERLIIAAGDKSGYIGLWDVDSDKTSASATSSKKAKEVGVGGVFKYRFHVGNICRIFSWNNDPSKVHSVSYDGTIRTLDFEKPEAAFTASFIAPEGIEDMFYTDACEYISPSTPGSVTNKVFTCSSDGFVRLVDFRMKQSTYAWSTEYDSKIQSVQHFPTDENLYMCAFAGQGADISIYDIRKQSAKAGKSVVSMSGHTKSMNAAYASPDGKYIVSVSQDNTIKLWYDFMSTKKGVVPSYRVNHDNHTGRWLSTFRPVWDPKHAHAFVMGSMARPRMIEVFTVNEKTNTMSAVNLKAEFLGSVCSRNAVHPSQDIIAASNSSGRVHVLR